jgi:hypothetical protein
LIYLISFKLKNRDGVVSLDDFERYIKSNPDLSPMFHDLKDRVRMDSVTIVPQTDQNPAVHQLIDNHRNMFITQ